jgi:riboflavin biosynthesis pyrimidine reductase
VQLIFSAASGPGGRDGHDGHDAEQAIGLLARAYAYPDTPPRRPWVRANMIASVDGAATTGGRSTGLGGPADHRVFGVLRALADAIVVGAGTARAEMYGPARHPPALAGLRAGRPATPPIVVVSAALSLDPDGPLLAGAPPDARTIVLTARTAPAQRRALIGRHAELIVADCDELSAAQIVAELAAHGHRRILLEGGPRLLAQFAAEGQLDEMCVSISPVLVGGDAGRITAGGLAPGDLRQLQLAEILTDDGYLFCRYRARRA